MRAPPSHRPPRGGTCSRAAHAIVTSGEAERVRDGGCRRAKRRHARLGLAAPAATRHSQRLVPSHDTRARGSGRATKARVGSATATPCAAHRAQLVTPEGTGVWKSQSRDARATDPAGSRGAPLARTHDRVRFRGPCNRRDAAWAGGSGTRMIRNGRCARRIADRIARGSQRMRRCAPGMSESAVSSSARRSSAGVSSCSAIELQSGAIERAMAWTPRRR